MLHVNKLLATLYAGLLLIVSGCTTVEPYNYNELRRSSPRSIVVIPPANNTVEVNAPYIFLATISQPLAEKGYYVFPVSVIEQFLKENGMPTPEDMNAVPLDKIREHIGADAALYVSIEDWGQKYQVLSSKAVVSSKLRLVDTRTGQLLWESTAYAEYSPGNNSGGGLAGALVSAVVGQVLGSMVDQTARLSKTANMKAINQRDRGLLPGPYISHTAR